MKTFLALLAGGLLAAPLLSLTGGCDQSERRVDRTEHSVDTQTTPIVTPDNGQGRSQSQTITEGHSSTSSTNGERRIERTEKTVTEETTTIVVPDAPSD